jgi:hypothetical protein
MSYRIKNISTIVLLSILSLFLVYSSGDAKVTGNCANCHTMHASQNGTSGGIAFGGSSLPQPALLRGDCLGCHGQNTSSKIVTIGGSQIPQVLHTDASGDLAGGNFAYITGAKSRITADQNSAGHNVIDLGATYNETILTVPPGVFHPTGVKNTELTCAGIKGCHGLRLFGGASGLQSLKGAHHQNLDGKCNNPTSTFNSYRFLWGIKGFENTIDKWQNKDANSHNEYFGAITPVSGGCTDCHTIHPDMIIFPSNQTISGFCGTCHGSFHFLYGIGGDKYSPFTRHPTDVILPSSGEYTAYTTYSVEAPVARTTVPDAPSNVVQPGTDVVMCLSCHAAHATPYADILRWNYEGMVAGGSGSGGCFTCHTQKN